MFKANKVVCYRGRAYDLPVFYLNESLNQINTFGLTDHFLKIQNQDGSWIEKQCLNGFQFGLPLNRTYLGVFSFSAAETALFKLGANQSVFLKLIFGDNVVFQEIKSYLFCYADRF